MSMLGRRVARLETVTHGVERLIIVLADESKDTSALLAMRGIVAATVDLVVRVNLMGSAPGEVATTERVTVDRIEMPVLH